MFRVSGSSIFKVLVGQKNYEFRDIFRKGSKVRFGEALLAILLIFGCPLGSQSAPFGRENVSFLRSDFLMIFGLSE